MTTREWFAAGILIISVTILAEACQRARIVYWECRLVSEHDRCVGVALGHK